MLTRLYRYLTLLLRTDIRGMNPDRRTIRQQLDTELISGKLFRAENVSGLDSRIFFFFIKAKTPLNRNMVFIEGLFYTKVVPLNFTLEKGSLFTEWMVDV